MRFRIFDVLAAALLGALLMACNPALDGNGGGGTEQQVTACSIFANLGGGTCVVTPPPGPGGGPAGPLDPALVHLVGTLSEGSACVRAITHWSDPNRAELGFDCDSFTIAPPVLDPNTGAVLYGWRTGTESAVREYVNDLLVSSGAVFDYTMNYPVGGVNNDPIRDQPNCPSASNTLVDFMMSGDGELIHLCNDNVWYYEDGTVAYNGPNQVLYFGQNGLALMEVDPGLNTLAIVDLGTLAQTIIASFDSTDVESVRSIVDGFTVVASIAFIVGLEQPNVYTVMVDGTETDLGQLPAPPAGIALRYGDVTIGASNVVYQLALDASGDMIVRRDVGGLFEVLYTEASNPRVKIGPGSLFTGP